MIGSSMRFEISLQNFKKPLVDIFSPQMERKKRSEEYLIIILAVERIKALSDFLAWSSSLKTVNTGKPAKSFLRIFRDALILVFVNENCCLCQCFTELHFFYWLLEVSSNFNRFTVCFQSFINIACRSTQNVTRIKRFLSCLLYTSPSPRD